MRLGTRFSLTAFAIIVAITLLLQLTSFFVFGRKINQLNKELFVEKLERLVDGASEEDEHFFEGLYPELEDAQRKITSKLNVLYRKSKDPVTFPFIVNTQGQVIAHPAGSRWGADFSRTREKGELLLDEKVVKFMREHKNGEFEYESPEEGRRWCVFKTFDAWGWVFCMTTSKEFLRKPIVSFIGGSVAISLATVILGVLAALAVSRQHTRPIRLVISRLQEIAKGGSQAQRIPLDPKADDEVAALANAVNKMAEDLEKTTVSRDLLLKEIEERKRLETMVLQSEKMAAVGQLASGVAHEINNPLGVILGFSQSLVRRLEPGSPQELPLRSIEREAIRCKELVQNLLTFSRVSKVEKEETSLNELVDGSVSLIVARAKMSGADLIKELSPELRKTPLNKNQIQQVIVNLCNNAIDAMPNGGKIFLRTRNSVIRGRPAVELQVEDTGCGIPKELHSKIFEPFFTTKEVGKGTGLGLSLVYEIVQKHEGRISVKSEPGKGALFSLTLP